MVGRKATDWMQWRQTVTNELARTCLKALLHLGNRHPLNGIIYIVQFLLTVHTSMLSILDLFRIYYLPRL